MVGGVAGGEYRGEAGDGIAIAQGVVGAELGAGIDLGRMDWGAGGGAERIGGAVVVAMGVADDDAADAAGARGGDGFDMGGAVRAGIEHDEAALAILDEVGVGAVIGHDAGVGRHQTGDAGQDGERHETGRLVFDQERHAASLLRPGRMVARSGVGVEGSARWQGGRRRPRGSCSARSWCATYGRWPSRRSRGPLPDCGNCGR